MASPSPSEPFFTATPAQDRFFAATFSGDYSVLAYGGGIRSGKSATALMLAQLLCRIYPRSRWAIVRTDLPTIKRNVLPTFSKFRVPGFMGEVNQADSWTSTATNGSQIVFFSESIQEDPEYNRWRGLEVNGFFLEEANELQEASLNKAIERAGAWVVPGLATQPPPLVVCTFNPSGGWVKRKFYDPWKAGTIAAPWYYQPATIADNPHIPAAYLDALKKLPERDYKRFVEGDWSFISGAFFSELGADTHLIDPFPKLPDHWTYWGAYDWGFRHPAVFGSFAKDGDGNTYWLDTLRMHRTGDLAMADRIVERVHEPCRRLVFAGHDCFEKPEAHQQAHIESVQAVFAKRKIGLVRAYINRIPGWAAVNRALAKPTPVEGQPTLPPKLRICRTPGNAWAIERLLEMIPDPTDPDDLLKIDANEEGEGGDDVADMLRYGIARTGVVAATTPVAVKEDHRAAPLDLATGRPKVETDPERALERDLGLHVGPTNPHRTVPGAHRVPRR